MRPRQRFKLWRVPRDEGNSRTRSQEEQNPQGDGQKIQGVRLRGTCGYREFSNLERGRKRARAKDGGRQKRECANRDGPAGPREVRRPCARANSRDRTR